VFTSVALFIGITQRGPIDTAVNLLSAERSFGAIDDQRDPPTRFDSSFSPAGAKQAGRVKAPGAKWTPISSFGVVSESLPAAVVHAGFAANERLNSTFPCGMVN
jgi:hypothetical protein